MAFADRTCLDSAIRRFAADQRLGGVWSTALAVPEVARLAAAQLHGSGGAKVIGAQRQPRASTTLCPSS